MSLVGLNYLLRQSGIDLGRTRLVRHKDNRTSVGRSPYDLWIAQDGRFEKYQRIQRREVFKNTDWVISFVATPLGETLFTGVYRVGGSGKVPAGTNDPVHGHSVEGLFFYDLKLDETLRDYVGRIVVDWGEGFRSWVQLAQNQDKAIVEIRRSTQEPPFPGFSAFSWSIRELPTTPVSWQGILSAVSGVYLLVCRSTGKQYVGSAYGVGGFWGRWEAYYRTGHGGNEGMKLVARNDYQVSILEVAPSSQSEDEIIRTEGRWKDKLLTRSFGLNKN